MHTSLIFVMTVFDIVNLCKVARILTLSATIFPLFFGLEHKMEVYGGEEMLVSLKNCFEIG